MADVIQLLPDAVANKIAAGEVIQRPASVVKELLENSIDAGSTSIQLIIKDAGKSLIQVIDNGAGMSETDARMSFEKHATSKIHDAEDLFVIKTMGFRGEALASVAAVGQVELKTKREADELGTSIIIEGSELISQEQTACSQGTSISVKNLFFNIPARRNFLKSNPVELRHILNEFQRIALAHSEVAFSLRQQDELVYDLKPGKLSQRIVGLFGKPYQQQLATCNEATDAIEVKGYVGKPEFSKKTRGEQFFFINKRYIRSNYLNHAIVQAYDDLLPKDHYPFYVLFIDIDPKHVDVNVHPTKTEVNFDDERTLYGVLKASVRQSLGTHHFAPAIDFNTEVNFSALASPPDKGTNRPTVRDRDYAQFKNTTKPEGNTRNWESLYNFEQERPSSSESIRLDSAANSLKSELSFFGTDKSHQSIFQIHGKYILSQVKSGLMVVDSKAALERIFYERYQEAYESKKVHSQQLLFPQRVDLNLADMAVLEEIQPAIQSIGFDFEPFGKSSILIKGMPPDLLQGQEKEIIEGIIEQVKQGKKDVSNEKLQRMIRFLARNAAIFKNQTKSPQEMEGLIDQLFACSNPNYSPDGQLTFFILSLDQIQEYFNKKS